MSNEKLSLLPEGRISFQIASESKELVIENLLNLALQDLDVTEDGRKALLDALVSREREGSTGIGSVGIPHVKSDAVPQTVAALAVFPDGIDFQAVDGDKVYSVFLVISPTEAATEHVETLRWIATMARKGDFTRFMRQMKTPKDVQALLQEMGE